MKPDVLSGYQPVDQIGLIVGHLIAQADIAGANFGTQPLAAGSDTGVPTPPEASVAQDVDVRTPQGLAALAMELAATYNLPLDHFLMPDDSDMHRQAYDILTDPSGPLEKLV